MEPYLPQLRFFLDDLSLVDDEALRGRALTPEAAVALALLAGGRGKAKLFDVLLRWRDLLAELSSVRQGGQALQVFWRYALDVGDMRPKDLADLATSSALLQRRRS
ncbi:MAG TPA: hypothetical protein VMG12_20030 [Polyangiaceae bacterium]|nr:hypothetical protein [Polyangiaceae bacterium]